MPIKIKNTNEDDVVALAYRTSGSGKPTEFTEVYVYQDEVFPGPTSTGGVASVTISEPGVIRIGQSGTTGCTQRSVSPTGGTGFTCNATFDFISGSTYSECTAIASITNAGSGYSVGDVITLDITAVPDNRELTYVELTVASIS